MSFLKNRGISGIRSQNGWRKYDVKVLLRRFGIAVAIVLLLFIFMTVWFGARSKRVIEEVASGLSMNQLQNNLVTQFNGEVVEYYTSTDKGSICYYYTSDSPEEKDMVYFYNGTAYAYIGDCKLPSSVPSRIKWVAIPEEQLLANDVWYPWDVNRFINTDKMKDIGFFGYFKACVRMIFKSQGGFDIDTKNREIILRGSEFLAYEERFRQGVRKFDNWERELGSIVQVVLRAKSVDVVGTEGTIKIECRKGVKEFNGDIIKASVNDSVCIKLDDLPMNIQSSILDLYGNGKSIIESVKGAFSK